MSRYEQIKALLEMIESTSVVDVLYDLGVVSQTLAGHTKERHGKEFWHEMSRLFAVAEQHAKDSSEWTRKKINEDSNS